MRASSAIVLGGQNVPLTPLVGKLPVDLAGGSFLNEGLQPSELLRMRRHSPAIGGKLPTGLQTSHKRTSGESGQLVRLRRYSGT